MKVKVVDFNDKCLYFDETISDNEINKIMALQGMKYYKIDKIDATEVKYISDKYNKKSILYKYFKDHTDAITDINHTINTDSSVTRIIISL